MEKPAGFWIQAAASIIDVFIIAIFSFIMILLTPSLCCHSLMQQAHTCQKPDMSFSC